MDIASGRCSVKKAKRPFAFLNNLAFRAFVAYEANRGVRLRQPPDPKNREFIVSLRIQIETFVVKQGLSQLRGDALLAVENALHELKVACEGSDVAAVARCDMAFHEAILVRCGGDDFILAWKQLCSRMLLTYTRLDDYRDVYREHAELLKAIRSGKKREIVAAIKSNIR